MLTLSGIEGKNILSKLETFSTGRQVVQLDLPNLPAGIYFLKILIGSKSVSKKLIIGR